MTDHRAVPSDIAGPLTCDVCGRPVRAWSDGRFPIHADPRAAAPRAEITKRRADYRHMRRYIERTRTP